MRRIGDRLRKYDDTCELKTKKYIKTSVMSASSSVRMSAPTMGGSHQRVQSKPKMASFYSKEDILKNRI
jgi:hypothetical protein